MKSLRGRSFLTLLDFEKEEILGLLQLAHSLKAAGPGERLKNRHLVLLFEKRSTRTRCAFEIAMKNEGGHVTYLDKDSSQFSKKESIEDSARIFGSYYDAIEYRGFDQSVLEKLALYSGVPVYNGLTDVDHPTQILADLMTIQEHVPKPLEKVKVVFVGDVRNNMAIAWMYGCGKLGMEYVGYGPKELFPPEEVLLTVEKLCKKSGGSFKLTDSVADIEGADVLYTDVWVSMGEEDQMRERVRLLTPYRVTVDLIRATRNPNVKFMHCLPAFHDFETEVAKRALEEEDLDVREVTDEVFRSKQNIAFPEAVNRIHTIRAVLVATLADQY
ncbi:UNVERIFIED_CONTAM: hypothetical protein PYX00_004819 [Menopon gallinae]|uniref:ornithine carbamoyltransferase n=1 Tax=Menopon gallinae TaxID=328185 RepID=A0AAW2I7B9_9NEOP